MSAAPRPAGRRQPLLQNDAVEGAVRAGAAHLPGTTPARASPLAPLAGLGGGLGRRARLASRRTTRRSALGKELLVAPAVVLRQLRLAPCLQGVPLANSGPGAGQPGHHLPFPDGVPGRHRQHLHQAATGAATTASASLGTLTRAGTALGTPPPSLPTVWTAIPNASTWAGAEGEGVSAVPAVKPEKPAKARK